MEPEIVLSAGTIHTGEMVLARWCVIDGPMTYSALAKLVFEEMTKCARAEATPQDFDSDPKL